MIVLGINGGVRAGYQDISAVLMNNGRIVAAIEEERITRVKHVAGQLPIQSIKEVLHIANINIQDVSVVAFHGSTWEPVIETVLKNHFQNYFGYCPSIKRFHHHACHAASTFYASGFEEALIFTIDGSGDGISTQISIANKKEIKGIKEFARPQSLGIFYSMMTQLCGFTRDVDEYKLMGLSAYGNPSSFDLSDVLQITDEGYYFNTEFLVDIPHGKPSPSRYEMLFNQQLINKIGLSRRISKDIPQTYKDLAAATQLQLERALVQLIKIYVQQTGIKKICLAGGVALNCLANGKIEFLKEVEELFIQPASNDAGISLGAAYLAGAEENIFPQKTNHVFWGNSFTDDEVELVLKNCGVNFRKSENVIEAAATALAQNKVVGWFQGAMEFGPRALGSRSILANPSAPNIQSVVNQKVKFREGFRPFGASVLESLFHNYFKANCNEAPYMTKVFDVKPEFQTLLKGVTHTDGTCRAQTVNIHQHKKYFELLQLFEKKTGLGALLNTSFNLNHEPIVFSPRDAVASFFASGLDILFIENFVVEKKESFKS